MGKISSMASLLVIVLAFVAICGANGKEKEKQPRCQKQIEKQQQELFSSCHQYLVDGSRMSSSSSSSSYSFLRMFNEGGGWREEFPRCCQQLEQLDTQCRCQAVSQIVKRQRQGEELEEVEMQEMLQTARSLPNLCRLKPRSCDVQLGPY